jgi:uroporphyrinogen-III synthase
MKVWITRARPGAEATAARLTALGFTPVVAPLLEVRPVKAEIDLTGIDGLVFTSINAVAAFIASSPARDRPVFTVGDATARAASEAGFATVRSADGDLTALAALIRTDAKGLNLLHPAAAQPAGDLAALVGDGADVRTVAVYETVETDARPFEAWHAVLIHSPRAAHALALAAPDVVDRFACVISEAAAASLGPLPFAEVRVAAAPTEDALLAALGKPEPAV